MAPTAGAVAEKAKAQRNPGAMREHRRILGQAPSSVHILLTTPTALLCLASSIIEKMGNENPVTKAWLKR